ncbi:hypothetical protein EJ05DRAFT_498658 [Pseudovirgaria hyperparasitica]|uniref:BZIP domain-containing protein n=1 Tax=Pseudovirgaria hyperparasitica TaxID=470096 RepID=A0A6A6WBM4_9PEZI|nr:uncharacterized protein EJ05DRAFT_498658 [Pseudovirgaria hyperparasitica]KAF2759444.1 hypothetical protein EJ05DRAFT_498658 [Pseudovirgaria hyperparasitica]
MSGYNGRRPNVSQYIAGLNTIPSHQDLLAQPASLEEDLSMFNTDFFDFDALSGLDLPDLTQQNLEYDPAEEERARRHNASGYRSKHATESLKGKDALLDKQVEFNTGIEGADYQFSGFNFPNLVDPAAPANFQSQQQVQYNIPTQQSSPSIASPTSPTSDGTGIKRKFDSVGDLNGSHGVEDASRHAAEEDKRRRNTAASARFRVKKKQREQALEKSAKEMSDKVGALESKITKLETENRWLKELLTEKNGKATIASMVATKPPKESNVVRSTGDHTTGVGTDSKEVKA